MKFEPGNAQHVGAREGQQDAFGFSELGDGEFRQHGGFLAVVADGMGGLEHGDAASQAATQAFLDAYQTKTPQEGIPAALERSVVAANTAVYQIGTQNGSPGDIGTTIVAAVVHRGALYWIAVGDSPLMLVRENELTEITEAHTFERILSKRVEAGKISKSEARRHPEREYLTSYLGAAELGEFDRNVRPFPLSVGDLVLLASDGLSKSLTVDEIISHLEDAPQRACEALVNAALAKDLPEQDNITVVAIRASADEAKPVIVPATEAPARKSRTGLILGVVFVSLILAAAAAGYYHYFAAPSVEPAQLAPPDSEPPPTGAPVANAEEPADPASPPPEVAIPEQGDPPPVAADELQQPKTGSE